MNYIIKTILIGIGIFFLCLSIGLNTRISYNCGLKDNVSIPSGIFYIIIANILGPLYTIYYFFYRSSIKGKSCL